MGVLITHAAGMDPDELRRTVLRSGLECELDDVVDFDHFEVRVSQVNADIVFVFVGDQPETAVERIRQAAEQVTVPVLAVGSTRDPQTVMRALRAGAREYVDADDLDRDLDAALTKLAATDEDPRIRGTIISVYSPTSGTGSTTLASNLAAALARTHSGDVSVMELSRRDGDLALFYDVEPQYTVEDACQRSHKLDATSLGAGLIDHDTGVSVLAHSTDHEIDAALITPEAVRRIAVLLRSMFSYTILDLDSRLETEQLEAMKLSDHILYLIRADVPSVRRCQRMLDEAIADGVHPDRIHLVINRWGQAGQLPLKSIAETLDLEPIQLIPDDSRRVNTAINQGVLLQQMARGATITRRMAQLAAALNGQA